jgi:probable HAF family extracellular repeat protein
MLRTNQTNLSKRRLFRLLPCLFGGLVFAGTAGAARSQPDVASAYAQHPVAAPKAYRAINLRSGGLSGFSTFNAKDQIAISLLDETGASRAYFYDGESLRDIGTLGGTQAFVNGVNDAGEVAGNSYLAGDATFHAFKWSKHGGMRDLGSLSGTGVSTVGFVEPINNRGQVVGFSDTQAGPSQAFLWSPSEGLRNLGGLPGNESGFSIAHVINDAGMVAGHGDAAGGGQRAFVWTRKSGMTDLGTLGGPITVAAGISDDGLVVGNARTAGLRNHIFVWSRSGGIRDVGTAGGVESFTSEKPMSSNGNVAGFIRFADGTDHAALWTRAKGLVDLGTLGGPVSFAAGVNNKAQVVGAADVNVFDRPGIIWTAKDGMIDLNTRLRHVPPGLRVFSGLAISENGVILASTGAGFVLLKPDCGCPRPHTTGPINAPNMVEVGAPFDASVSFADEDTAARHNVFWSWGDGSGDQQVNPRESKGVGHASASHRYTAPGVYTVSAKVGDRSGQGSTVSRTVIAYEQAAGTAGGNGWFESPAGANKQDPGQAGRAVFGFFAPGATSAKSTAAKAMLQFHMGTLNFRSESIKPVAAQRARAQFEGSGKINGAGDYRFKLTTTAGSAAGQGQPNRFGLKIWHIDPLTNAEVVSYDNQGAGNGSAVPAAQGEIVLQ